MSENEEFVVSGRSLVCAVLRWDTVGLADAVERLSFGGAERYLWCLFVRELEGFWLGLVYLEGVVAKAGWDHLPIGRFP